jgi:hypothetical protein
MRMMRMWASVHATGPTTEHGTTRHNTTRKTQDALHDAREGGERASLASGDWRIQCRTSIQRVDVLCLSILYLYLLIWIHRHYLMNEICAFQFGTSATTPHILSGLPANATHSGGPQSPLRVSTSPRACSPTIVLKHQCSGTPPA